MASFKPPTYNSDIFDSGLFDVGNEALTLDTADARYLKLSGGIVRGFTTFNAGLSVVGTLQYNSESIDLTFISGITAGVASASKALVLNSSRNITNINQLSTTDYVRVNRTTNGAPMTFTNGTSTFSCYHFKDGEVQMGMSTAHNLGIMTNGAYRLYINGTTGNITNVSSLATVVLVLGGTTLGSTEANYLTGITAGTALASKSLILGASREISNIGAVSCDTLTVNGVAITGGGLPLTGGTLTGNLLISGTNRLGMNNATPACQIDLGGNAADRKIAVFNNGTAFYGFGANGSQLRNLSDGGHAWYTDSTTVSLGTTIMSLTNTGALDVLLEVDTPLIKALTSQVSGATATCAQFGHATDNYCRWLVQSNYAPSNFNSSMNIINGNQTSRGFNIGAGQSLGASGGALLTINGVNNDGSFVTTGTSACNGMVHINGGTTKSIPAGWAYTSTGSGSAGAGNLTVSLYCYQNIWVRGSMLSTSDRRLKHKIKPLDMSNAMNLLKVEPVWYNWKTDSEDTKPQLGLIAQDLLRNDLSELTALLMNDDVTDEDEEFQLKKGTQLVVSYDKIPLYLLEIVKKQQAQINDLQSTIEKLIDRPVVAKWLNKQKSNRG